MRAAVCEGVDSFRRALEADANERDGGKVVGQIFVVPRSDSTC